MTFLGHLIFPATKMPKVSRENFNEILKNDGYTYVLLSKITAPFDINFPNLPDWHKEDFEEYRRELLPDANVIRFEYKGSNYKLLSNVGDADCNGTFQSFCDACLLYLFFSYVLYSLLIWGIFPFFLNSIRWQLWSFVR